MGPKERRSLQTEEALSHLDPEMCKGLPSTCQALQMRA